VCWTFLSLCWSENPGLTIRRLGLIAMMILGALAVAQRFSPYHLISWVFFSTLLYLNVGVVAELKLGTFHPFSWGYRFSGTIHPNGQGVNCVLLLYASLFLLKNERRWRSFLVMAALEALIFLFLAKSRTAFGIGGVALLVYWGLMASHYRKAFAVLCLLWLTCLVILFSDFFFPIFRHAIEMGREDTPDMITLTGRIPLWGHVLSYIAKKPIFGYGYGSFWGPKHIEEVAYVQGWAVTHAHSALFEISLGLGLVGGIIYVVTIFVGIGRALAVCKKSCDTKFGFMVVVLIFSVLDGMLDLTIITPGHAMFVNMVILAGLGFSYDLQQKKERQVLDGKNRCECKPLHVQQERNAAPDLAEPCSTGDR
jgi:O-antigen ligase